MNQGLNTCLPMCLRPVVRYLNSKKKIKAKGYTTLVNQNDVTCTRESIENGNRLSVCIESIVLYKG